MSIITQLRRIFRDTLTQAPYVAVAHRPWAALFAEHRAQRDFGGVRSRSGKQACQAGCESKS